MQKVALLYLKLVYRVHMGAIHDLITLLCNSIRIDKAAKYEVRRKQISKQISYIPNRKQYCIAIDKQPLVPPFQF